MWDRLGQIGSFVGGMAAGLGLVFGLWGFNYAQGQIDAAREASLQDTFREFRSVQLAHPELATPDNAKLNSDASYRREFQVYLSVALSSWEQALSAAPGDVGWERTVDDGLNLYRTYITPEYIDVCEYSVALQKRIRKISGALEKCQK